MLIKTLRSKAPPYTLRRRLGTFERGVWWSGIEAQGVKPVVCAVLSLDRAELARLDLATQISRDWLSTSSLIGAEMVPDGQVLVAYDALPDEPHRTGRPLALSPRETLTVAEQSFAVIDRMHRAGFVHCGLSGASLAIARGAGGVTGTLRGIGLPSLPGRSADDDLVELASLLRFVMVSDGSELVTSIEGILDRVLGLGPNTNVQETLYALRSLSPRPRSPQGRRASHTAPNMVAALRQVRAPGYGVEAGFSG